MNKSFDCHYPASTIGSTTANVQHNSYSSIERRKKTVSVLADPRSIANLHDASSGGDAVLNSVSATPDSAFTAFREEQLDWDISEIDFVDFMNPPMGEDVAQYFTPPLSSMSHGSSPVPTHTIQLQQLSSPSNASIPVMPTFTSRSLIQRPRKEARSQRSATLMLQTLVSYPRIMLRHKNIPSFIHPSLLAFAAENNYMEPLNNCISLMNMVSSGVRGVRKLFWRNVQQECQRFCNEVS